MFRIIFFITYLPLLVYVYWRCLGLFKHQKHKSIFLYVLLIFALAFPIFDYLAHTVKDSKLDILIQIGFYTQPYLLYLFFLVLLVDIGQLIFRYSRQNHHLALIVFTLPFMAVIFGAWKYNHIKVNHYDIEIPKKESTFKTLRIVFASDFHLRGKSELNALSKFVKMTNELKADLVLLPGDILEGDHHDAERPLLEEELKKLQSTSGVYAVLGNHESYGKDIVDDFFEKAHVKLLRDHYITIPQAFTIAGRDDLRFKSRKEFESFHKQLPLNLPIILMDHRPNDFQKVKNDDIAIQVSGHTHNGQIFPFNYITHAMYDLSWGHKQEGSTHFFVTSGLRGWGPQVRTTGDAEIIVIDVTLK